jgi:hypothetical protein
MNVSSANSAPVQSTQQPTRTQARQQTETENQTREQTRTQAQNQYQANTAPKPVVNTQGQTTGQLLNVTA